MKKLVMSLIIGLALMVMPSIAATGHINGCTNTGEWNGCCSKTFNITPKTGYRIVDVIVNGVSKGAITSYTFQNITGPQTLKVITEPIQAETYTITYNLDGGTVSGTNPTSYTSSDAITLINPTKSGYNFTGWTGTGLTEATDTVTIPTGSTGNRTYTATWEAITYTITYNLNGGTVSGTNPTSYTASDTITLINPTKEGYTFAGWTGTNGSTKQTTVTIPAGSTGNRTYTANWKISSNAPALTEGLTPVNWDGSSWVTTTEANWDYNYNSVAQATHNTVAGNGNGKWANAQTADGSLYVWIPRYSYKIISGEHQGGNSWNNLDNPGTNKIEVKFSDGTTDDTTDGYIAHPAFTFGTTQLQGIWVAKYEASQGTTTSLLSAPTSTTSVTKSIPNVVSWRNINANSMFDYAYNTYRNADSHLMKNIEWGAVAYLTNAIGRIPYINNNADYITGNAGGNQDAASSSTTATNVWNTENGVKASTTHNVYGIYDMSGGADEFVSAYNSSATTTGLNYISKLKSASDKYVDRYNTEYDSSKKGDAIYESSSGSSNNTAWDGGASRAFTSALFVLIRGGDYNDGATAGVFYFLSTNIYEGNSNFGFRVVLGIQ